MKNINSKIEKCSICGEDADHYCSQCEEPTCDKCEKSDWTDQRDLCASCKDGVEERRNEYLSDMYDKYDRMFSDIKRSFEKSKLYHHRGLKCSSVDKILFLKFCAMAESINWQTSNVCSPKSDMSNKRYREIAVILENDIHKVHNICQKQI